MRSEDGEDAQTRLIRAREPQDDLEARRMRAAVEQELFGESPDPIKIGRYVVLERLGAGGVGIVYAAYDPELDRRVALKVLRPQAGFGSTSSADARARLRREAQAMAQLNHPNVITVYEVGEVGDEVHVAMELVDGEDLSAWIKRGPHPWRDVVSRFVQAGRGLAAAHRAGLVHRDFKPSNVLEGSDGRLRVLDFGLAKLAEAPPEPPRLQRSDSRLRDSSLTFSGSVVGTPAYMAPEQHAGDVVDARTDQFAFCVALFEGLYGRRPFVGRDLRELERAKRDGDFLFPEGASGTRVPSRLRRALARGFSPDPDLRHPSMDALVSMLEHDPRARRLRWAGGALVVGSVAVTSTLWAQRDDPAQVCARTADRLHAIWDDAQRERIRARFEATKVAYAADSFSRIETALDTYASQWATARTEVCEADLERGSSEVIGRQVCLDSRLHDLAQLTELLAAADPTIVQNAVEAVGTLPPVPECLSPQSSTKATVERERLVALQQDLTRARTLRAAGKYAEARDAAKGLREAAADAGVDDVKRRAMLLEARLHDDLGDGREAERALLKTLAAAESAQDDFVTIEAMLELVFVLGVSEGQPEAGLRWATFAEARIDRAGTPKQRAQLFNHRGILLKDLGQHDDALATLTRALELRKGLGDTNAVASSFNNLGIVQLERGQLAAARHSFERAHELVVEARGANHPGVANPLGNLATVYVRLEEWDRAEREILRAREVIEETFGRKHPLMASTLNNLGTVYHAQRRLDEALDAFEDSIAIASETMGEDHPIVGTAHVNVAGILAEQGRVEEARRRYERSVSALERAFGSGHASVIDAREARDALDERVEPAADR